MPAAPLTLAKRSWLIEVLDVSPDALPACEVPGAALLRISPARQAELMASRPGEILSASSFVAHGLDKGSAAEFLGTAHGKELLATYMLADPSATPREIYLRAMDQLATGSDIVWRGEPPDRLVKVVPAGTAVSAHSPFFTEPVQLEEAAGRGLGISEYFGLPLSSQAELYDIYEIRRLEATCFVVSHVAPTEECGGEVCRIGGALQYVLADRRAWSQPKRIGQIPEMPSAPLKD